MVGSERDRFKYEAENLSHSSRDRLLRLFDLVC